MRSPDEQLSREIASASVGLISIAQPEEYLICPIALALFLPQVNDLDIVAADANFEQEALALMRYDDDFAGDEIPGRIRPRWQLQADGRLCRIVPVIEDKNEIVVTCRHGSHLDESGGYPA